MAERGGIEALLYLMDEAFRGPGIEGSNESQALLPNLTTVDLATWRALPPGAARRGATVGIPPARPGAPATQPKRLAANPRSWRCGDPAHHAGKPCRSGAGRPCDAARSPIARGAIRR
jgi:hypothetical protein